MITEKNCMIAQSGGPTTVINSSLAGVISRMLESNEVTTVYGCLNGITGIFDERYLNLTEMFKDNDEDLDLLKHTPSMFLASCRYKLPTIEEAEKDYEAIFEVFKKHNIKYFFYNGGNDSMDTVSKLTKYAKSINYDIMINGVPKTIDNDLMHIDHTPGYASAAKFIASTVLEVAHDTYSYGYKTVVIIEIMGRNAGWLTAAAALARNDYNKAPHLIYLPEVPFSKDQLLNDIEEEFKTKDHVIVAVSEGVKDADGNYISASSDALDQFGHAMLSGTAKSLQTLVENKFGCKVRCVELSSLQRCASHLSSPVDVEEAFNLGRKAADLALNGEIGKMATLTRTSNSPYTVEYGCAPVEEIANAEKNVPREWINEEGNDVTEEMVQYIKPLIQGESNVKFKDGIPHFLSIKHITDNKIDE